LKEKEEEKDDNKERQTGREGKRTRIDSKLKKTRIRIPGLN
jgi:hypothetical protein